MAQTDESHHPFTFSYISKQPILTEFAVPLPPVFDPKCNDFLTRAYNVSSSQPQTSTPLVLQMSPPSSLQQCSRNANASHQTLPDPSTLTIPQAMPQSNAQVTPTQSATQNTQTPARSAAASVPASLPSKMLPPCRVCGARASGLHYGVNTCKGCKGFFGRFINKNQRHRCKYNSSCRLSVGQRLCPSCRLQKCLDLGMSKNSIKMGRSSYKRTTAAIEEVQALSVQNRIHGDGKLTTDEEQRRKLDDLVTQLTNVHLSYTPHSDQHFRTVRQAEQSYLMKIAIEDDLYGDRASLPRSQYNELYQQTGLDVDGRRKRVRDMAPLIKRVIDNYHKFMSNIPGYPKLSKEDQLKIERASASDTMMFHFHHKYDVDTGVFIYPYDDTNSLVMTMHESLGFNEQPENLSRAIMTIVSRLQALELTHEETVLASALVAMIADADLSDFGRKITSASADYLSKALVKEIDRNHGPEEHTLAKLVLTMADMRNLFDEQTAYTKNMIEDTADVGLPQSFVDFYKE